MREDFLGRKTASINEEPLRQNQNLVKKKRQDVRIPNISKDMQNIPIVNEKKYPSCFNYSEVNLPSEQNVALLRFYNESRFSSMSNITLIKPKFKNNHVIPVLPSIFNKSSTSI